MPVFHPLYMTNAFQLLRGTCTYCHHFLASEVSVRRRSEPAETHLR